jgi:hypothetical protein
MTVKLWQLVGAIAAATLLVGIGFGRYVVPNDPVNRTGSEFEQHLNDAYKARRGDTAAQGRIAKRYGTPTTPATSASGPSDAASYVRAAIPALEAWYADHNTYAGASFAALRTTYDSGIANVEIVSADATSYCVQSTAGTPQYHKAGPAADILPGPC